MLKIGFELEIIVFYNMIAKNRHARKIKGLKVESQQNMRKLCRLSRATLAHCVSLALLPIGDTTVTIKQRLPQLVASTYKQRKTS